jgi:hypothetical protein
MWRHEYKNSAQAINVTITVYLICQGLSPVLFTLHTEFFGRRAYKSPAVTAERYIVEVRPGWPGSGLTPWHLHEQHDRGASAGNKEIMRAVLGRLLYYSVW